MTFWLPGKDQGIACHENNLATDLHRRTQTKFSRFPGEIEELAVSENNNPSIKKYNPNYYVPNYYNLVYNNAQEDE